MNDDQNTQNQQPTMPGGTVPPAGDATGGMPNLNDMPPAAPMGQGEQPVGETPTQVPGAPMGEMPTPSAPVADEQPNPSPMGEVPPVSQTGDQGQN